MEDFPSRNCLYQMMTVKKCLHGRKYVLISILLQQLHWYLDMYYVLEDILMYGHYLEVPTSYLVHLY